MYKPIIYIYTQSINTVLTQRIHIRVSSYSTPSHHRAAASPSKALLVRMAAWPASKLARKALPNGDFSGVSWENPTSNGGFMGILIGFSCNNGWYWDMNGDFNREMGTWKEHHLWMMAMFMGKSINNDDNNGVDRKIHWMIFPEKIMKKNRKYIGNNARCRSRPCRVFLGSWSRRWSQWLGMASVELSSV